MPPRPRIVIAGQIPPPTGGQNVMVARLLEDFRAEADLDVAHLPFHFTPAFSQVRRFSLHKLLELLRIALRLAHLRLAGPIDWIIAPSGGPQTAPIVRDILLLPLLRLAARRLCIQFHAAGIAGRLPALPAPLRLLLRAAYRGVDAAVVMTEFNRRDPAALGIPHVHILPHRLEDEPVGTDHSRRPDHFLYMGHLCPDKGTDLLLEAFAALRRDHPEMTLELAGEPIPPWDGGTLRAQLDELGLRDAVILPGVLHGAAKRAAFTRAGLFVFPTRAPYESFGLVLVEAMRAGLPIIATEWRGNRDVAAGSAGVLWCRPGDASALRDAMRAALGRHDEHAAMAGTNRKTFEHHYLHDGRLDPRWRTVLGQKFNPPSSG